MTIKQAPRQVARGRPGAKDGAGASEGRSENTNGAMVERPQRRRDNADRREGEDRHEYHDRRDRQERLDRRERQGRPYKAYGGEKAAPRDEGKQNSRPVVQMRGNVTGGSMWAKGGSGPSFAEMLRQKNQSAKEKPLAKEPVEESSSEEDIVVTATQVPVATQHQQPPPLQPQTQPQQQQPSIESELQAPVPPIIRPPYVLEIERVVPVNLPAKVIQTAEAQRTNYIFSAQAGKPPTPPAPQQTVYRQDAANLGVRQWTIGSDSRIQQTQQTQQSQQSHWPSASHTDYWVSANDRTVSRPFAPAQLQYNSYPTTAQPQSQQTRSSYFSSRLRTSDVPDAAFRQNALSPFNRPAQSSNGGGVW